MAKTIYSESKWVQFECGPSLRQMFQMGDRWVEENPEKTIENVVPHLDECLGEWFMTIYYV